MARRVVFTNPLTGRFVSEATAASLEGIVRSVYDGGLIDRAIYNYGERAETVESSLEPNWELVDSKWGQRWYAEDEPLDLLVLRDTGFPEQFDSFRVTFNVADNPDYPRKYGSSEWMLPDQWPPSLDMLQGVETTGIAQIVFRSR